MQHHQQHLNEADQPYRPSAAPHPPPVRPAAAVCPSPGQFSSAHSMVYSDPAAHLHSDQKPTGKQQRCCWPCPLANGSCWAGSSRAACGVPSKPHTYTPRWGTKPVHAGMDCRIRWRPGVHMSVSAAAHPLFLHACLDVTVACCPSAQGSRCRTHCGTRPTTTKPTLSLHYHTQHTWLGPTRPPPPAAGWALQCLPLPSCCVACRHEPKGDGDSCSSTAMDVAASQPACTSSGTHHNPQQ
jgi:hypothetical protein